MFTGLVEEVGVVGRVNRRGVYQLLRINAQKVLDDLKLGDSVAVNGVCQTVTELHADGFSVETLEVSLQKTSLGSLKAGSRVNLERALQAGARMGGHVVQGHVDGLARITAVQRRGENVYVELVLPQELARYCVSEGSVAVEGISLTIAALRGSRITLNVIPTTWRETVLSDRRQGDRVNIEVDIMARYVERLLTSQKQYTGVRHE
ncbi:MAG: riboflavin synthase [Spirochaetia bacterium]|nr:riboflavin synthase [Spirochaetia bacterium]